MSGELLGVLGGLGPLCGALFYRRVIEYTDAACDNDHISVLLDGRTDTPDRSAFLCGDSPNDPFPLLLDRARNLIENGATVLALPCNTAHGFYRRLQAELSVPLLHMISETVATLCERQVLCVGILCTEGTRRARLYDTFCAPLGIRCLYPAQELQRSLDDLIFSHLKAGKDSDPSLLTPFCDALQAAGASHIVTGCTELSLCAPKADPTIIDSLDVLARRSVLACGKRLCGRWAS